MEVFKEYGNPRLGYDETWLAGLTDLELLALNDELGWTGSAYGELWRRAMDRHPDELEAYDGVDEDAYEDAIMAMGYEYGDLFRDEYWTKPNEELAIRMAVDGHYEDACYRILCERAGVEPVHRGYLDADVAAYLLTAYEVERKLNVRLFSDDTKAFHKECYGKYWK